MQLGNEFIIAAIVIFFSLLPLYIYVKKRKAPTEQSDLAHFKHEIQIYFRNRHPYVELDYCVFNKTQSSNVSIEALLIIENLVNQFIEMPYSLKTQLSVGKEILWSTYEENSGIKKDKLPKDWLKRKDLTYRRDQQKCKRCGQAIKLNDAYIGLVKKAEEGGTYHFENLITFCIDCNRIMKAEEKSKLLTSLKIYDDLVDISNHYS